MRICIFGAGSIGGFMAAYLCAAKNEVSLIARGANLEAYKKKGITLQHGSNSIHASPQATNDSREMLEVPSVHFWETEHRLCLL